MANDFRYVDHGSLVVLQPITEAARRWVEDNIQSDAQYWCKGVVIEPRYVADIVEGLVADGLTVERP